MSFRYIKVARVNKNIVSTITREDEIELPKETGEYVWFDVSGLQYKDTRFNEMEITGDYDIVIKIDERDERLRTLALEARADSYPAYAEFVGAFVAAQDGDGDALAEMCASVRKINDLCPLP